MEDFTTFIINITNVKITSYSDSEDNPAMATLVPTKIPQPDRNQKSAFSILRNSELNLTKIIGESNITEFEQTFILTQEATISIVRSNFEMSNIEVSNLDPSSSIQFLLPIYLQDKLVKITNSSFNLTERILYSVDPLNMYIENVLIDLGSLSYGIFLPTSWNYPEASKTGMVYVNNITAVHSAERKVHEGTSLIVPVTSYNISVTNIDISGKLLWLIKHDFEINKLKKHILCACV